MLLDSTHSTHTGKKCHDCNSLMFPMDRSIAFRDGLTQGRTMRGHNVQVYDVYLWAGLDEGRVDQGEGLHDPLHHHVGCLL